MFNKLSEYHLKATQLMNKAFIFYVLRNDNTEDVKEDKKQKIVFSKDSSQHTVKSLNRKKPYVTIQGMDG